MKKFIFLFIFSVTLKISLAQTLFTSFKKYATEDGLVSNSVQTLLQDSKGYLWIGTVEGVSRFDGKNFTNYGWSDNSLPSKYIFQMMQANDSLILFATKSGIAVFNINRNQFQNEIIKEPGLQAGSESVVASIVKLPGNKFLVSYTDYFALLDSHLKLIRKRKVYTDNVLVPHFLNTNPIFTKDDSTRVLFMGIIDGTYINEFNIDDFSIKPTYGILNFQYPFAEWGLTSGLKFPHNEGAILCPWGAGFIYLNPSSSDKLSFYLTKEGGEGGTIRSRICRDPNEDSIYWMGSGNGLIRFNTLSKTFIKYYFTPGGKEFHPNFIHDILFDKDGNLWLATYSGIIKISRLARAYHTFNYDDSKIEKPYAFGGALSDSRKRIWSYVFGRGAFLWDSNNVFVKNFNDPQSFGLRLANDFKEIDQTIYATTVAGVFYYDEQKHNFFRTQFFPDSLKNDGANFLFVDSKRLLWIGVRGKGLLRYDLNSKQSVFYTRFDSVHNKNYFPMQTASASAEDSKHNLWFGRGHEGSFLVHYLRNENRFEKVPLMINGKQVFNCIISDLKIDKDDNLWIAMLDFGVLCYNIRKNSWKQYDRSTGLTGNAIESLALDSFGNLWTSDANGIAVLLKNQNRFRKFTKAENFPFVDASFVSFPFKDEPYKLVFGNDEKLLWFDTRILLQNPSSQNIFLENVLVENSPVKIFSDAKFSYEQSHFNFQFAGINLLNGEQNQYSYKLENWDKDWINCGNQHNAIYSNLKAGDYVFKARVSVGDNKWSVPVEYAFTITPAFYDTWWFRILMASIVVSAVYGLYRLRINRIIEMERVRSRISRDLHDDIGSTLSSINILTRSAKKRADENDEKRLKDSLEKIGDRTQRMLDNMSDIIWSVKPENDSLEKILARMREYASAILEAKQIQFNIDFPDKVNDVKLSLELKNNMFLIYKEAVNNLAKYSECKHASIKFSFIHNKIEMIIEDDGKGISPLSLGEGPGVRSGGNGLLNMQKRAEEVGAVLTLTSEPGKGTRVKFERPL